MQVTLVLTTVTLTNPHIRSLGSIFGYALELGWFGIPLTVVTVIGRVNAFTMIDGIDGLAGGLALVVIAATVVFAGIQSADDSLLLIALLLAAELPCLLVNLELVGRKVFWDCRWHAHR